MEAKRKPECAARSHPAPDEHLLDLDNGLGGIEALWAGLGAIQIGMAAVGALLEPGLSDRVRLTAAAAQLSPSLPCSVPPSVSQAASLPYLALSRLALVTAKCPRCAGSEGMSRPLNCRV